MTLEVARKLVEVVFSNPVKGGSKAAAIVVSLTLANGISDKLERTVSSVEKLSVDFSEMKAELSELNTTIAIVVKGDGYQEKRIENNEMKIDKNRDRILHLESIK